MTHQEPEQDQEPHDGGQPSQRVPDLSQGKEVKEQAEQRDADGGPGPGLHRRPRNREFWSARSPTAQMISAARSASTALSERLSRETSWTNLASPASATSAPRGMNTLSGLKNTMVRRISRVKS